MKRLAPFLVLAGLASACGHAASSIEQHQLTQTHLRLGTAHASMREAQARMELENQQWRDEYRQLVNGAVEPEKEQAYVEHSSRLRAEAETIGRHASLVERHRAVAADHRGGRITDAAAAEQNYQAQEMHDRLDAQHDTVARQHLRLARDHQQLMQSRRRLTARD